MQVIMNMKYHFLLKILLLFSIFVSYPQNVLSKEFRGRFVSVGTLQYYPDTLTRLKDGRILLSLKGFNFQIYNQKTKKLEKTNQPKYERDYVRPIVLNDGRVFIPGVSIDYYESVDYMKSQEGSEYAEIYNPVTDTYTRGAKMNIPRFRFGVSKLHDGRLLITNGYHPDRTKLRLEPRLETDVDFKLGDEVRFDYVEDAVKSEIYDPDTDTYTLGPDTSTYKKRKPMSKPELPKDAEKQANNSNKPILLELDNSSTDKYSASDIRSKFPDLHKKPKNSPKPIYTSYINHSLGCGFTTTLSNGKVLVLADSNFSELYNPDTNSFELIKNNIPGMSIPLNFELFLPDFLLPDNRVFIPNLEIKENGRKFFIYDPVTNKYSLTSGMGHSASWNHNGFVVLKDGRILLYGGLSCGDYINGCSYYRNMTIYDPKTDKFVPVSSKVPKNTVIVKGISLDNGDVFFITQSLSVWKQKSYGLILKIKE